MPTYTFSMISGAALITIYLLSDSKTSTLQVQQDLPSVEFLINKWNNNS